MPVSKMKFSIAFITISGLFLLAATSITAAPGELDSSFGSGGKVVTPFGNLEDFANGVVVQPDGKIIAVGATNKGATSNNFSYDFALVRYNTDGTLDNSFGTGGKVTTDFGNPVDEAFAVALQPDGKIVVVGEGNSSSSATSTDFAIARYNTNGTLDTSFGTGGKVTTPIGSSADVAFAVIIQSNGKIVVAGESNSGTRAAPNYDFALVRYNTDGTLDTSFGAGGKVITPISSGNDTAYGVALQADGKIVAVGQSGSSGTDFALVRYNTDGTLDSSFGASGKVTTDFGSSEDGAYGVVIQTDGKIVVVGQGGNSGEVIDFALARYNTNGTLDNSFGTGGKVVTPIGGGNDVAYAIAIQSNGKIVIAGFSDSGTSAAPNEDFAVARYNANGTLDTTFGAGGKVITPIGSSLDNAEAVAIQPDGKIVAAGFSDSSGNDINLDFAVVRYLGDPVAPRSTLFDFDGDGKTDYGVFRPSNGVWYLQNSRSGFAAAQFGISTDKITPADFDGDGKTDIAVYRSGTWYLLRSMAGFGAIQFGLASDIPVPADFDGDGKAELAVYRPSNGVWYVLNLANNAFNAVQFGISTDKPVAADYDGDGKADYAVFRPESGTWYLLRSAQGFGAIQFGSATDKPVVGDYDGDGKSDIAVWRPSNGVWYLLRSAQGFASAQFGTSTDLPVPGDYDGDGKTDYAVFRPGNNFWYVSAATQADPSHNFASFQFGVANDKPIPNSFVP